MKKYLCCLLLFFPLLAAPTSAAQPPAPAAATAAAAPSLALHRALYAFHMKTVDPGARLIDVGGKMYFEQDETCDAYTTEHRFTTEYQYADQRSVVDTSHYVSFESKDGAHFNFNARSEQDGELTEQLRGALERADDGTGKAVYSRPDDTTYDLPKGYLLPTAHTLEIIRRARAGEHFFSAVMFDGTDADGPAEVGTFIGKKAAESEIRKIAAQNKKIDASLLTPDAWHVRMAIFPLLNREESEPAYEMETILHDNGVISYALVNYKTLSIEQELTALDKIPPPKKCN